MTSDIDALLAQYEPALWVSTLAYRANRDLPFNPSNVGPDASLLFDTTVYIDMLAGRLPSTILDLIASRRIYHAAPAMAELALPLGYLDPKDRRTAFTLAPILRSLRHIPSNRIVAPNPRQWLESTLIGGILARTQGIAKPERRRFLNDVLVYLAAGDIGATVVTRNTRDFDLLMQVRPGIEVLFYERP